LENLILNKMDIEFMYVVYMVECKSLISERITYYTGYTNDPMRRLEEHLTGKGVKYLKHKILLRMIICQEYRTIKQAMKGEKERKKMTRWHKKFEFSHAFHSSIPQLKIPLHGLSKNSYPYWYLDKETNKGCFCWDSPEWMAERLENELFSSHLGIA